MQCIHFRILQEKAQFRHVCSSLSETPSVLFLVDCSALPLTEFFSAQICTDAGLVQAGLVQALSSMNPIF